ncbi:SOS response-associated peptidase [Edaphobacter modestus]|uniref:Abasic site processing protein n=1 Tax=Edaphobacter modestus TaxID=388466 RepID=A0A4Q7YEW6_9BACT|nr:SOS response associated peptidase (SRAP) [Edaphobacter modestus]
MCGRYCRRSDKQKIAEHFRAKPEPAELPMPDADYNIAPTTYQPIIRQSRGTGEREMILARWGLVPFFTKDLNDVKGLSTINARAETITKAPRWREPLKKRRCLVPASLFHEWPKEGKPPKQPYAGLNAPSLIFELCPLFWFDILYENAAGTIPAERHMAGATERRREPRGSRSFLRRVSMGDRHGMIMTNQFSPKVRSIRLPNSYLSPEGRLYRSRR